MYLRRKARHILLWKFWWRSQCVPHDIFISRPRHRITIGHSREAAGTSQKTSRKRTARIAPVSASPSFVVRAQAARPKSLFWIFSVSYVPSARCDMSKVKFVRSCLVTRFEESVGFLILLGISAHVRWWSWPDRLIINSLNTSIRSQSACAKRHLLSATDSRVDLVILDSV